MTIECVFCDIIAGRGEASVVYRDEQCIAVMDICTARQLARRSSMSICTSCHGFRGDGFGHKFPPPYGHRPPREELESVAATIRASLGVA